MDDPVKTILGVFEQMDQELAGLKARVELLENELLDHRTKNVHTPSRAHHYQEGRLPG